MQPTGKTGEVFLDVQVLAYMESIRLGPNFQSDVAPYTETGKGPLFALCEDTQGKKDKVVWKGQLCGF